MKEPDFEKAYSFLEIYENTFKLKDITFYNTVLDLFITFHKFEEAN